ncbi:lauroyl acyltransferase [Campylobacterota bacterium]|nr:lauroyl acyltransferase [Campylobacterota bacterium]
MLFYSYKTAQILLRLMPSFLRKALSFVIARIVYFCDTKHRKIVYKNLDYFLGDISDKNEQKRIAKMVYLRFVRYLFDLISCKYRNAETLSDFVTAENDAQIRESIANNEKIIMITAHYGYWELIGQSFSAFYRPLASIAVALQDSKRLTAELDRYRERYKIETLPKKGAMRGIAAALKQQKIVGFLPDQSTQKGASVKFFGRDLVWQDSASRLAKQFDAVIYPAYITTDDFNRYTINFGDPIRPDCTMDKESDIARMAQLEVSSLEAAIRRKPDEYFWLHKRLKHQQKHFYD